MFFFPGFVRGRFSFPALPGDVFCIRFLSVFLPRLSGLYFVSGVLSGDVFISGFCPEFCPDFRRGCFFCIGCFVSMRHFLLSACFPFLPPFSLRFRLPSSAVAFFRVCVSVKTKSRRLPVFAPLSFFGRPRALFSPSRRLQTVDYPHALSKKPRLYRSAAEKQAKIPESRTNRRVIFTECKENSPGPCRGCLPFLNFSFCFLPFLWHQSASAKTLVSYSFQFSAVR